MNRSADFLILHLDAPMQAWGGVAMDPVRPTQPFPTRSALAGMLGSALGWTYRDGAGTTALQDAIRYAVREIRPGRTMRDYQTADLGRIGREGWTRWGMERRGGGTAATGTQILEKEYIADGSFLVALTLDGDPPVTLEELESALQRPSRPLFLGRKGCIPASPIVVGRTHASSSYHALVVWSSDGGSFINALGEGLPARALCWYAEGDGPDTGEPFELWDRRDFQTDRFGGPRSMRRTRMGGPGGKGEVE